jgi:opacity protein-like surface antigen
MSRTKHRLLRGIVVAIVAAAVSLVIAAQPAQAATCTWKNVGSKTQTSGEYRMTVVLQGSWGAAFGEWCSTVSFRAVVTLNDPTPTPVTPPLGSGGPLTAAVVGDGSPGAVINVPARTRGTWTATDTGTDGSTCAKARGKFNSWTIDAGPFCL